MDWRAARALVDAIVRGLEPCREQDGVNEVLLRLGEQRVGASEFSTPQARALPACRHLPGAIAALTLHDARLAAAIAVSWDKLAWRQNPNYSDAAMGQRGY